MATRLGGQLEKIVLNRIATDRLAIPLPPGTATTCQTLAVDPECPLDEIVSTVERDPVLAVQVMRAVDGVGYTASEPSETLAQAVRRLGAESIKSLLLELATRKLHRSRNETINQHVRAMREHSLAVAMLSRDLSALSGSKEGEVAFLAGLLHDVGKLVMAAMLLEAEKEFTGPAGGTWIDANEWMETVQQTHRTVAVACAEKWRLPGPVTDAIRDSGEFDAGNRAAPANFVRFANALAKLQGIYVGPVDRGDAAALMMVGRSLLGLDDVIIERLSTDLKERTRKLLDWSS